MTFKKVKKWSNLKKFGNIVHNGKNDSWGYEPSFDHVHIFERKDNGKEPLQCDTEGGKNRAHASQMRQTVTDGHDFEKDILFVPRRDGR